MKNINIKLGLQTKCRHHFKAQKLEITEQVTNEFEKENDAKNTNLLKMWLCFGLQNKYSNRGAGSANR